MEKRRIRITREVIKKHVHSNPSPKSTEEMMQKFQEYWRKELLRGSQNAGIVIFNNCVNLIAQLPVIPLDKSNSEDDYVDYYY